MSRERRVITRPALRAESYSNGGGRVLRGTAAAFHQPTRLGDFHEVIASSAFTRALRRGDDVRALVNHDPNLVLGRTKSGTLKLSESARTGLDFQVTLPDTQAARDLWESVKRGDMDACSFAFQVDGSDGDSWQDDWTCGDEDCCRKSTPLRTLRNLRLFDVSVVTYPAYAKGTSVSGMGMEDLSRDPDAEDDDNGADGAGDPWTQYSGVIVSAEARSRARRAHRHTAAKEATDFAANLFRAQVRATKTLLGGQ